MEVIPATARLGAVCTAVKVQFADLFQLSVLLRPMHTLC